MVYSPFFQTIHDERAPLGTFGRGTHHSVLRAVSWHDTFLFPQPETKILDFAVIWDEDHDERVIKVAEELYLSGLLGPIRFVGERKAVLTLLLDQEFFYGLEDQIAKYKERMYDAVRRASEGFGDAWQVDIDGWKVDPEVKTHAVIADDDAKVACYLQFIHSVWELGIKPRSKPTPLF